MSSTKIDFLYLNEEEMVKAGVTDMHRCVEVMGGLRSYGKRRLCDGRQKP